MAESVSHVNVQVAVRCRPLNNREKARGNLHVVTTDPNHNRVRVAHKKVDRTYQYDHVFGPFASQEEVFTNTVEPIVREMLQGFSTTVFAYGQTGTGKTHTMEGDINSPENMGVIPRSVHAIFDYLEGIRADYTVRTSFLELYNEELQDLLADCTQKSKVVLREDSKRGVICCGLEEVQVVSAKDIFSILEKGIQQRKTAQTLMNKNSSRSHSIFTLKIMIKEWMPDGQEVVRNGQLNLVDLAGSECVGRSGAKNVRAREAGNINQSLLTLGRVITALVEHHPHVPYRDSKLTRLLQESLGGKAKTCIIATVTSSSDALDETISSLDYALKAKNIENKPVANHKLSKTHLLKEYAGEVDSLRSMLQASREKNGIYVEPWRFELMENTIASQSNQIAEMENIVASKNSETKELKTERDSYKLKSEELEGELKASKEREEATSARLAETLERLELTEKDLAASRALVDEQRNQIAVTQQALKVTEEELGATRAVVMEQAATERALTAEAEQTKVSLVSAEQDVEGLYAKVSRQDDEAAEKRANALAFGDSVTAATAEVSGAVAMFAGKHSEGCQRLLENVTSAETAAKAAAKRLAEATAHGLTEVNRRCKEMSKSVLEGSESVDNLVEVASTALDEAVKEQKDAISAWHKEVGASLGALRQGLVRHEQDLSELSEGVRIRAQDTEREMSSFRDACVTELTEVRAWADERIAAQTEQMKRRSEEAMEVAARSKEETKAEVEELMQSFSKLMSGLQANASERADRQASVAGEAWSRSILAARSLGPEISDKMGGVAGSLESKSKNVVEKMVSSSCATQNALQEQRKAAVAFASSVEEACKETSVGAARSSSAIDSARSSLKENLAVVSARVIAVGNVCVRDAEAACKGTEEAAERVAGLSLNAEEESAEKACEMEKKVESLASAVGELETTHTSSLNHCVSTIEDHVEEACRFQPPSNGTPEKKRYPRPELFSATRSTEEIMREFRNGEEMSKSPRKCAAVDSGEGDSHDISAITYPGGGISSASSSVGSRELGMEEVETCSVAMLSGGEGGSLSRGECDNVTNGGVELEISTLPGRSVVVGGSSGVGTGSSSPPLGEATNTSVSRATKIKIPGMRRSIRRARAK